MAPSKANGPLHKLFSLDEKVTVITGGARGIGFALAEACAEYGSAIALLDILDEPVSPIAELEAKWSVQWKYYRADVTNHESLTAAFNNVMNDFARVDNCITAAGIALDKPFLDHTENESRRILDVNVMGTFLTAQIAAKHIISSSARQTHPGGSILFLSSQTAHTTTPQEHTSMYAASKGAVKTLALHLGVELAPHGIRVNSISPGYIETEMGRAATRNRPEMEEVMRNAPPLGRRGQTEDLLGVSLCFLSGAGSWITGTDVKIDGGLAGGGMHLRI
ncbi:short-chain dehydrogenase/reductase SDR [Corynespora cassiicola Philippines]|uniref:Short-chain dehydrogenase/reductase SDR n=1 Tax=Corynespora cassiicola Philippines TaxID=1448308 RepID=A0A2T2NVM1_CORCC|nr:short-chain dehydrogenase/reductase SDR [Corynespora cassiicola Philippines]